MNRQPSYKAAGVDLDTYNQTLARLPRLLRRTATPRVMTWPAGFAGLFSLDYNTRMFARNYRHPVLVSGTDGVGTKLKLAILTGRHTTVGIDLVAMCVNDVLCAGAEPLFFLDYVAMARDDPELSEALVLGVSDGCIEADCALIGGETAILPGSYPPGEYDLAGFCVGVVERHKIIDGRAVRPGDVVLGLASTGLHSNGYSLARAVVFDQAGLAIDQFVPELGRTVADALLEPTRIYARPIRDLLAHYPVKGVIHAIAHITGGGIVENLPRVLPAGCRAVVRRGAWPVPPVFGWLQTLGDIAEDEMDRVFNRGIGLVVIASPYYAKNIQRQLADHRVPSWVIGRIEAGGAGVAWE